MRNSALKTGLVALLALGTAGCLPQTFPTEPTQPEIPYIENITNNEPETNNEENTDNIENAPGHENNIETPNEDNVKEILTGIWKREDGIIFYFDKNGLDYYGKEQFGINAFDRDFSREFTDPRYGTGTLTDYVQTRWSENSFSSVLSRSLLLSDFNVGKQAIVEGKLLNNYSMELIFNHLDEDFYNAFIGNGIFYLTKEGDVTTEEDTDKGP